MTRGMHPLVPNCYEEIMLLCIENCFITSDTLSAILYFDLFIDEFYNNLDYLYVYDYIRPLSKVEHFEEKGINLIYNVCIFLFSAECADSLCVRDSE